MWNINIRQGAIWSTKSYNETEESYEGMSFGNSNILILSAFQDVDGYKKYTYCKVCNIKREGRNYIDIELDNSTKYIQIDELNTGDQRALQSYISCLDEYTLNKIIDDIQIHFKVLKPKKKRTTKTVSKVEDNNSTMIHKFGIDIYVTENDNVKISKSKRLILSQSAKDDIIYNSQTENDLRILCDKYQIYPIKAIREIKNRLVYQHKQKEG